jgi:DNA-binding transcriptional LysR family regulator
VKWMPNAYQLRTLLAVAQHRSFKEAAEEQHITVSAVSQQMLTLSRETQTVLYERRGNKVQLTDSGLRLAEYARQIVQLSEDAARSMAHPAESRLIRVSLVTSIAEGALPQLYQAFRKEQPEATFRVDIQPGVEIIDALNGGNVDVALLPSYGQDTSGIERFFHEQIVSDRLVAVVRASDPLATEDEISLNTLSQRRLFLESQTSPNCRRLLERFRQEGLKPDIELFCPNNSLAIRMALTAGHVAVVPEVVARTSQEATRLLPLTDGVSRSLHFCCPSYVREEPIIAAFRAAVHRAFSSAEPG